MSSTSPKTGRFNPKSLKAAREEIKQLTLQPDKLPNAELIAQIEAANFQGICYHCGSRNVIPSGVDNKGRERQKCQDCQRYFTEELTKQIYDRLRNVQQVVEIQQAENPHQELMNTLAAANFKNICYHCGSREFSVIKRKSSPAPRRKCHVCKRSFTEGKAQGIYERLQQIEPCPRCGGFNCIKGGHSGETGRQIYKCKDCHRHFVEGANDPNQRNNRNYRVPLSDDVWLASSLGLRVDGHQSNTKLIFNNIKQDWLKEAVKKYIRYIATTKQYSTILGEIATFNWLSRFLVDQYPKIKFETINRSVILDLMAEMNQQNYSAHHKIKILSTINKFFECGVANNWFSVQAYLILQDDFPKDVRHKPRFIPEEVIHQLNQHLDALPAPVMRMVLVIQECGLRIGELLQLRFDCLKQDAQSGWFLQFMRWKLLREDTIPISAELAAVIMEQQQFIRDQLGDEFDYLFSARTKGRNFQWSTEFVAAPKVMSLSTFMEYIKKVAERFEIKDANGKLWNFQSHQFRHTVGTRMINNGVPQHIVQRYLGHICPRMTSVYAHIYDQTLKKEIDQFHAKVVNIAGEVIHSDHPELDEDLDLQWLKRKILGEVLPNGYCGLPVTQTCSKGNACLTCGDFRTTQEFLEQHQEHRERILKVIDKAQANNWQRQIQVNSDILQNLDKIIDALEEDK